MNHNPFLAAAAMPYEAIPFDKLSVAVIDEAIREACRMHNREIEDITDNAEPPTFGNTIEALDRSGKLLSRAYSTLGNLLSADTNDELQSMAESIEPLITEHFNNITLNVKLFQRVKAVVAEHDRQQLSPCQATLLDDTYQSFVRHGANLSDEDKASYRKLSEELGLLTLQFGNNVLKETADYELHLVADEEVAGLPDSVLQAAREASVQRGKEGYVFTLQAPSYVPFMKYATNRELRRKLYEAYTQRCARNNERNNYHLCARIAAIRHEVSQLLGYATYADYVLPRRMAKDINNVNELLMQLLNAYKPVATREMQALKQLAYERDNLQYEHFAPYDSAYYANAMRERDYAIDEEKLREYFPLDNVIKGVFGLATRLYGISFAPLADVPVYHRDVKVLKVIDKGGAYLGLLYLDFYARESKRPGAWMTEYKDQYRAADGTDSRPHISLVMNFTKPSAEAPSLLTLDEVNTFLHEFGHALHGLFADSEYVGLSGTNVERDFVELPSQFMENFLTEQEFLNTFAFHYKTQQPLPAEMLMSIIKARNFNVGIACLRQLSFGLLDMQWHSVGLQHALDGDCRAEVLQLEAKATAGTRLLPALPDAEAISTTFSHIFAGGYAAGYYSYKWAEVLDADAFALFKEEGIFNTETADNFRKNILSRGGEEHPAVLYRRFRGKEPSIEALLQRDGVSKQQLLDRRYIRMASIWAENSYCQRRQVGALIVKDGAIISDGYNGTPSGFPNVCEDSEDGSTLPYVLHAEANAITKIARSHNNSAGATLYVTTSPCMECAKLIIQAGIKRVVYNNEYRLKSGIDLLRKAGIECIMINECMPHS